MKKRVTVTQMEAEFSCTPKTNQRVKELEETISRISSLRRTYQIPQLKKGHELVFGVIGDTQIGSLYQRLDAADSLYDIFANEGVTDVFHTGDVLEGHRVYKGQEFELCAAGWEKQSTMFRDNFPKRKNITTHFITGNHDASFKSSCGIPVGESLEAMRPDCHYMGADSATIELTTESGRTFKVMLVHPNGGTAYAISYKMQKMIEALSGGTKPDMLAEGHFHKADLMPAYRNVCGVQSGCLQDQTPFMKRGGLAAHVGGWLFRVTVGTPNGLANRIRAEWFGFFEPES